MKKILFFVLIVFIALIFLNKNKFKPVFYHLKKSYLSHKFSSCYRNTNPISKEKIIYVAGHSYGHPEDNNKSTYPKFISYLNEKNIKSEKIILAGDIVQKSNLKNLLSVKKELNNFFKNIYVAPGNHDVKLGSTDERKVFLQVFKKNFNSFFFKDNLFFILDTTINPGNITADQLKLIKNELSKKKKLNSIFIITHHVIWENYVKQNVQSAVKKNFFLNNNFGQLKKILLTYKNYKSIIFIAGDVSVTNKTTKLFCEKNENFYYLMTGMGSKNFDNYLKISISEQGKSVSIVPVFF